MVFSLKQGFSTLLLFSLLSGCAVVPKFSDKEVPVNCQVFTKSVELDFISGDGDLGSVHCEGNACGAVLLLAAGVFVASAVVSSSIYVVGNTAHWLEKTGRCDDEELVSSEVTEFSDTVTAIGGEKVESEQDLNEIIKQQESDIESVNAL